jgi:hypothetical protein
MQVDPILEIFSVARMGQPANAATLKCEISQAFATSDPPIQAYYFQ